MRIGVVADTHVAELLPSLPAAVGEALAGVDLILHAGDLTDPSVLDDLRRIAPVVAVRGNHDEEARIDGLPRDLLVRAGGLRIGLTHGHRWGPAELSAGLVSLIVGRPVLAGFDRAARRRFGAVDIVVVGHLHLPMRRRVGDVLVFSPGAVYTAESDPHFDWRSLRGRLYRRHRARLPAEGRVPAVGIIETGPGGPRLSRVPLVGAR